jgi:hypothetical protein
MTLNEKIILIFLLIGVFACFSVFLKLALETRKDEKRWKRILEEERIEALKRKNKFYLLDIEE